MTEKRFKYKITDGFFDGDVLISIKEVVDVLNTQQTTINKQLDQIIELQDKYRILEFNHSRLEKRNKAQYEKIGEQQATINELKAKLKEKEEDEQLYANEIVKLNKEAKEVLDFKSLGGDY